MINKAKKVAYIGGCWSTNVGNGFFNLGADYVLKQVFGTENVNMVMDQSAFTPGWKRKKGNIPWAINYWEHLNATVLLGLFDCNSSISDYASNGICTIPNSMEKHQVIFV